MDVLILQKGPFNRIKQVQSQHLQLTLQSEILPWRLEGCGRKTKLKRSALKGDQSDQRSNTCHPSHLRQ